MTTGMTGTAGDGEAGGPPLPAPPPRTVSRTVAGAAETEQLGEALAELLRPGDLVLLSGELGAGKTTLTRGIGVGLGVRGPVTSPTFVIAREHPPLGAGPALVHVDAYRLGGGPDEMADLDLDVALPESVVVVEWGEGVAEELAEDRLLVRLERSVGGTGDSDAADGALGMERGGCVVGQDDEQEPRIVLFTGAGPRWSGPDGERLAALAGR